MPRFVVLEHDHPFLHWDLMLEKGDSLKTWRLACPPDRGKDIAATFLFHHRRMYLDYEGPVSGNRGSVKRWDTGTFEWQIEDSDRMSAFMAGDRVRGRVVLRRMQGDEWIFRLG